MPEPLLGIEFGGVLGQWKHFQTPPLLLKPSPDLRMGVIGSVVLDEINPMPAAIVGGQDDFLDEGQVGGVVEILGLVPVGEPGVLQTNGAENLLGVPFPARGNLWPAVQRSPGLMQGRALAERGFVHIDDHRVFGLGVFFRLG